MLDWIASIICESKAAAEGSKCAGDCIGHAIDLWKATGEAHNAHWTYYFAVTSGVLGYAFSETFSKMQAAARIALFTLFAIFLATNLVSMASNFLTYNAATLELRTAVGESMKAFKASLCITPVWIIVLLHVALDVGALAVLGVRTFRAPAMRRRAGERKNNERSPG